MTTTMTKALDAVAKLAPQDNEPIKRSDDFPAGAIHNGEVFIQHIDGNGCDYPEWEELKKCFRYLAEYVQRADPHTWQPIETAPMHKRIMAWWPIVELDDELQLTETVIGGNWFFTVQMSPGQFDEPDVLDSSGSLFDDDYSYAEQPTLWMPEPPAAAPKPDDK